MAATLTTYDDYRSYLQEVMSASGRGIKSQLARFLTCQTSFVSQVLSKRAHLSLEHALLVVEFLNMNERDGELFMLLVQRAKAGSKRLEQFFTHAIDRHREREEPVRERIQVSDELSEEQQALYYSYWWYSAIHIMVSMPNVNSREDIYNKLNLAPRAIDQAIDFLLEAQLIDRKEGGFCIGRSRIHLGSASPLIGRHHANWRLKCAEVVQHMRREELHFSGIYSLARADLGRVQDVLMEALESVEKIVGQSSPEVLCTVMTDLFEV